MSNYSRIAKASWFAVIICGAITFAWLASEVLARTGARWGGLAPLFIVMATSGALALAAAYATYKAYFERFDKQAREAAEASRLHLATVEALATAIDAKDQTTHCHLRRVQLFATRMGELVGLSGSELRALHAGALLHDVGKLAVPDHILNKPNELTSPEFERMKIHTTIGAQILERVGFPYPVVPVVLHHHERWDGRGYPAGLKGEEIPLTARVFAVVDAYDTAREERPYRSGMSREEASELLQRGSGTSFDPQIVDIFLSHLAGFEAEITAAGLDQYRLAGVHPAGSACVPSSAASRVSSSLVNAPTLSGVSESIPGAQPTYLHRIRDAHREVFALYEIARTFSSSLDLQDIVSIIVNKVGHIVPFDDCVVYLYDEAQASATVAQSAGRNAEVFRGQVVRLGEGVVGRALAARRVVTAGESAGNEFVCEGHYRSVVALPLARGEQLLGALAVYALEAGCYSDDHLRLLDTVTRLASDALYNAINHAEMESNALTDPLTGLPNARALHVRFEEEVARTRRTRRSFQIVMLDLDGFKLVNDTFGHKMGDILLREVGRVIGRQLREYDFLARYAGDEFVLIVQDVGEQGIAELCSRIERAVLDFRLHVRADREARVGVSAGHASFATHGESLDQLLMAADAAMYNQKTTRKQARRHETAEEEKDEAEPACVAALETDGLASTAVN